MARQNQGSRCSAADVFSPARRETSSYLSSQMIQCNESKSWWKTRLFTCRSRCLFWYFCHVGGLISRELFMSLSFFFYLFMFSFCLLVLWLPLDVLRSCCCLLLSCHQDQYTQLHLLPVSISVSCSRLPHWPQPVPSLCSHSSSA